MTNQPEPPKGCVCASFWTVRQAHKPDCPLYSDPQSDELEEKLIKHMVDRFLGWKLPADFQPDAGISFKPTFNEHTPHPMKHEPVGTNLFTAPQATEMVRYMLAGKPKAKSRSNHEE